jgi:hypothetical protein
MRATATLSADQVFEILDKAELDGSDESVRRMMAVSTLYRHLPEDSRLMTDRR